MLPCHFLFAQQQQLDSLKAVLEITNGPLRLAIFEKIIEHEIAAFELEEAKKYAKQALSESEKMNFLYGIAKSLRYLSQIYNYQGKHQEAIESGYRSLKFSEKIKDILEIACANYYIGLHYLYTSKYDTWNLIFFLC